MWRSKSRWLRLRGWCLHTSNKPVIAIRVVVGGREFITPLGIPRPDVIRYFAQPQQNLRCGFFLDVRLPRGRRMLVIEAQMIESQWTRVFAVTARGPLLARLGERQRRQKSKMISATECYRWWYDRPAEWQRPTRVLYITGWCLDTTGEPIHGIRAKIGRRCFRANIGIPREDVFALHPELVYSRRSGFAVAVPLPRGASNLLLQLRSTDGIWRSFDSHRVRHGNRIAEIPPAGEAEHFNVRSYLSQRFLFWVHVPNSGRISGRGLLVSGWCFATDGPQVTAVRARVGRRITSAHFGIVWRDVAMAHDNRDGALRSGFSIYVQIPRGRHQLVLEAGSTPSKWEPFFETTTRRSIFSLRSPDLSDDDALYADWIRRYERLTRSDKRAIAQHARALVRRPRFSIILPIYESDPRWFERAVMSVRRQFYSEWELCIVDDASIRTGTWSAVQRHARADDRIKIFRRTRNGGIVAASNDALSLASGEFIALLDHDDEIAPTALYFAALELERDSGLRLIYTDEDKIDARGRRHSPYFKPEWNPDLFLAQNYISHLTFLRTDLVRAVGGFRAAFEGSQDYDLLLRCVGQIGSDQIVRIPRVLYHWRVSAGSTAASASAKPYAHAAAIRAVQEHLDMGNIKARATPMEFGIYQRVRYSLPHEQPLVSIIIPSRDQSTLLEKCIASVLQKTDYSNSEIIIIDNQSIEERTRELYRRLTSEMRIRIIESAGEFNFSRLINLGATHARGQIFLLLNNDVEIINADWLTEIVSQVSRPTVGVVGARLWYPNGQLQHGGVILGMGVASHIDGIRRNDPGYFARQHLTQDFCAVTAACLAVRREVFEKLGGFDESHLPVTFNDVDFCLRAREAGWRVIYTPHAELIHHESVSRGVEDTVEKQQGFFTESEFMLRRWSALIRNDPAYNPNLSLGEKRFALAFPPRVSAPWKNRFSVEGSR
jgi:GT2 family glycosyltransferase